jgi:hypothetical protein
MSPRYGREDVMDFPWPQTAEQLRKDAEIEDWKAAAAKLDRDAFMADQHQQRAMKLRRRAREIEFLS